MDERGRGRVGHERRAELLAEYDRSGLSGAAFARWAGNKYPTVAGWLARKSAHELNSLYAAFAPAEAHRLR